MQYMIFCHGWDWSKIYSSMMFILPITLLAVLTPNRMVRKYYKNNHFLRSIITYKFMFVFAFYLMRNTNTVHEIYADNKFIFFIVILIWEVYPTIFVEICECVLYSKKVPYFDIMFVSFLYWPTIIAYLVFFNHENHTGEWKSLQFSRSCNWDSWIFRAFVLIVFMCLQYYYLRRSGYHTSVYEQLTGYKIPLKGNLVIMTHNSSFIVISPGYSRWLDISAD